MKKMHFVFISLLLCAVLCFTGCSSSKISDEELSALRKEYPSFKFLGHPMMEFIDSDLYTDMSHYIDLGVTDIAVVEICGHWSMNPYHISPVDDPDSPLPAPSLTIGFLPVRVVQTVSGNNPNVTEGAELMIHFGMIDLNHTEMIQALQPGKPFVFMLIPSEGFLPESMVGDNVFTSGMNCIFHLTENNQVLSFSQDKILEQYAGMPLERFQKEMQKLFQNVDPQKD